MSIITSNKSNIQLSLAHWCLERCAEKWSIEQSCEAALELGIESVELVDWCHLPILKKYGLKCGIVQLNTGHEPPFIRGWNNQDSWPLMRQRTCEAIDVALRNGCPNVITFTGFNTLNPNDASTQKIPLEEGAKNCVEGLKSILDYAENMGINVCLEMLNSRVCDHPMKGHPGYQGDHIDYCADIIRATGSSRAKLLFDIYHVQIMDGDIVSRIRQHKDILGHIHVAGVPGRCELDLPHQEINFSACVQALHEINYRGYVGIEFIPTKSPIEGLRKAVNICKATPP